MVRGAAQLLRERGYTGTGFREVIEITGAPRGSIYHHFPGGKAQLAGEAVEWIGSVARGAIEQAFVEGGPIAGLRAFVEIWREEFERSGYRAGCPILAVAVENHDDDPELLDVAARAFDAWRASFAASLRDAGVNDPRADSISALVVSAVEGAIVLSRAERDAAPLLDVAAELEDVIAAALPDRP